MKPNTNVSHNEDIEGVRNCIATFKLQSYNQLLYLYNISIRFAPTIFKHYSFHNLTHIKPELHFK